ncbi:MAG: 2,3,4,5-tetrahydropyridine-2,6-dicarboxylate N-succinyltransferase [Gluconacetobacter diazotrophicus]|nr:2,3,4,5-tetrahydropyridine-2,6-dicarboxylate N-succinyltransferase [Gluconacetobacter diazotrophicus]
MHPVELRDRIEVLWERRAELDAAAGPDARDPVDAALDALDRGELRVAEPTADGWVVHQWLKKAVLLSFRLNDSVPTGGVGRAPAFDKVPLKSENWDAERFAAAGFRAVPGAVVRRSAFVAPGAVLMPCFVNVGARVGANSMIDTWATVGSCAQIGRDCHVSGGAGIGGVLEPLQADPVIIEDGVFVGARSEVAEGVRVERGAVIAMGVFLGASTRIVDRATGEVFRGRVPAFSVVVPGTLPPAAGAPPGTPSLGCAVIVKRVDETTRAKTSINELLRD